MDRAERRELETTLAEREAAELVARLVAEGTAVDDALRLVRFPGDDE